MYMSRRIERPREKILLKRQTKIFFFQVSARATKAIQAAAAGSRAGHYLLLPVLSADRAHSPWGLGHDSPKTMPAAGSGRGIRQTIVRADSPKM